MTRLRYNERPAPEARLAALYDPVWTSAIRAPVDVAVAAVGLTRLLTGRVPPVVIVALSALGGQVLSLAWIAHGPAEAFRSKPRLLQLSGAEAGDQVRVLGKAPLIPDRPEARTGQPAVVGERELGREGAR